MKIVSEIEILDIGNNISPKDYLTTLLELTKQSTPENSIVFDFDITTHYCHSKVTKYNIDGSKDVQKEVTFKDIKDAIENLIEPFLKTFANTNKIVINNISSYREDTSCLKVISEFNDMCNIQGIDENSATRLSEMIEKIGTNSGNVIQERLDNQGVGNVVAFALSILILGIAILGMLIPNFLK